MKELLERAQSFEDRKMSRMTTSDRVKASREAKELILAINQFYKENRDTKLMDVMKRLTTKKKKIDKRLMGRPTV